MRAAASDICCCTVQKEDFCDKISARLYRCCSVYRRSVKVSGCKRLRGCWSSRASAMVLSVLNAARIVVGEAWFGEMASRRGGNMPLEYSGDMYGAPPIQIVRYSPSTKSSTDRKRIKNGIMAARFGTTRDCIGHERIFGNGLVPSRATTCLSRLSNKRCVRHQ